MVQKHRVCSGTVLMVYVVIWARFLVLYEETNKYVYLQNDYVSYMRELFYIFFADSNQQWLPPEFLSSFADEVPRKEVPLQRCWVLLMALCVLFVDHSKSKNYLSWA